MCQNGAQMGGGRSPQNCSFLLGFLDPLPGFLDPPPLGAPRLIFIDFWPPWASFWHPFWVPLDSFLLNFAVPGHHFGTIVPHQNDAQGMQNSMKMNPQTNLAGFIFVEC